MSLRLPGEAPEHPICSRAGCTLDAAWNVNWRNPKIHGEERVKVWLACDDHRDFLRDFLGSRDFPVMVTPLGSPVHRLPPTGSPA